MKWTLGKWKLHKMDEMERSIISKSQRNAYLFLIAALLIWSLYESYRVYAYHGRLNPIPCLLLAAAAVIQTFSQLTLMRNAVKDNEDSHETGPFMMLIALLCVAAGVAATAVAAIVLMGAAV